MKDDPPKLDAFVLLSLMYGAAQMVFGVLYSVVCLVSARWDNLLLGPAAMVSGFFSIAYALAG